MKCECCGKKFKKEDNSLFLRQFLDLSEIEKLPVSNVCVSCKKELMFANLIEVI